MTIAITATRKTTMRMKGMMSATRIVPTPEGIQVREEVPAGIRKMTMIMGTGAVHPTEVGRPTIRTMTNMITRGTKIKTNTMTTINTNPAVRVNEEDVVLRP
jgi:hypothetical protein